VDAAHAAGGRHRVTRVAFVGLGRMGAPMAARLAAAGHEVAVFNRTPRPELVPGGASSSSSCAEAAAEADVIVTMLADGAALNAVLDGDDGLLAGARAGAVLVDMSTIGPDAARAVAARAAAAGLEFLDAPVSGSVPAAQSGQLVAMVGGELAVLDRVRDVLGAMTRDQLHLGPTGAGAAMKLALNLALAVTNETIAETLLLAERAGISRAAAYDVLAAGALASPFVGYKREAFADPLAAPVAFSVDLMRKDVTLALALADAAGLDVPAGRSVQGVLSAASAAGLGDRDIAAVLTALDVPPG
jgi:3-hydroxyisobutyrate dehydrogenase/2-hydroxy-3-oxopropionate reductase